MTKTWKSDSKTSFESLKCTNIAFYGKEGDNNIWEMGMPPPVWRNQRVMWLKEHERGTHIVTNCKVQIHISFTR